MGTYCWCAHALQTSTFCEGSGTQRPLLVYHFSVASLHNCMPDSFSLDTYHLEHICEDTQSRIFELCSSRGGLRFCGLSGFAGFQEQSGLLSEVIVSQTGQITNASTIVEASVVNGTPDRFDYSFISASRVACHPRTQIE